MFPLLFVHLKSFLLAEGMNAVGEELLSIKLNIIMVQHAVEKKVRK
jgi:hypothetical protein